ncbi:Jmjc domain-containing protein 4-like [Plakobranchus ocellatus]|uniref:Jmjc domain-containing protein 4-like n=1 Tax=Plakobranchus ocellatus TaxID=259542 RepID=A0AAV4B285_9GAST|nr:Jmjc domain-containing protein 4-like [Plakobranchus ocellatus]
MLPAPEIGHSSARLWDIVTDASPYPGAVYLRHLPSYDELFSSILSKNQLCIVGPHATSSWKSRRLWVSEDGTPNFKYITETFGQASGPVADCNAEEFCAHPKTTMTVESFISYWQQYKSDGYPEKGRCLYLKDWHFAKNFPDYFAYTTPEFLSSDWLNEFYDGGADSHGDDDYSIHHSWRYLKTRLLAVQKEIADCREMEEWDEKCQMILKADAGIDYAGFYTFMITIARNRIFTLKEYLSKRKYFTKHLDLGKMSQSLWKHEIWSKESFQDLYHSILKFESKGSKEMRESYESNEKIPAEQWFSQEMDAGTSQKAYVMPISLQNEFNGNHNPANSDESPSRRESENSQDLSKALLSFSDGLQNDQSMNEQTGISESIKTFVDYMQRGKDLLSSKLLAKVLLPEDDESEQFSYEEEPEAEHVYEQEPEDEGVYEPEPEQKPAFIDEDEPQEELSTFCNPQKSCRSCFCRLDNVSQKAPLLNNPSSTSQSSASNKSDLSFASCLGKFAPPSTSGGQTTSRKSCLTGYLACLGASHSENHIFPKGFSDALSDSAVNCKFDNMSSPAASSTHNRSVEGKILAQALSLSGAISARDSRNTDSLDTGTLSSSGNAGSLASRRSAGSLDLLRIAGNLASPGDQGSLASTRNAGSLASPGNAGSLASPGNAGSLTSGNAGSLASTGNAGSLASPGNAGSLASPGIVGSLASSKNAESLASPGIAGNLPSPGYAGSLASSGNTGSLASARTHVGSLDKLNLLGLILENKISPAVVSSKQSSSSEQSSNDTPPSVQDKKEETISVSMALKGSDKVLSRNSLKSKHKQLTEKFSDSTLNLTRNNFDQGQIISSGDVSRENQIGSESDSEILMSDNQTSGEVEVLADNSKQMFVPDETKFENRNEATSKSLPGENILNEVRKENITKSLPGENILNERKKENTTNSLQGENILNEIRKENTIKSLQGENILNEIRKEHRTKSLLEEEISKTVGNVVDAVCCFCHQIMNYKTEDSAQTNQGIVRKRISSDSDQALTRSGAQAPHTDGETHSRKIAADGAKNHVSFDEPGKKLICWQCFCQNFCDDIRSRNKPYITGDQIQKETLSMTRNPKRALNSESFPCLPNQRMWKILLCLHTNSVVLSANSVCETFICEEEKAKSFFPEYLGHAQTNQNLCTAKRGACSTISTFKGESQFKHDGIHPAPNDDPLAIIKSQNISSLKSAKKIEKTPSASTQNSRFSPTGRSDRTLLSPKSTVDAAYKEHLNIMFGDETQTGGPQHDNSNQYSPLLSSADSSTPHTQLSQYMHLDAHSGATFSILKETPSLLYQGTAECEISRCSCPAPLHLPDKFSCSKNRLGNLQRFTKQEFNHFQFDLEKSPRNLSKRTNLKPSDQNQSMIKNNFSMKQKSLKHVTSLNAGAIAQNLDASKTPTFKMKESPTFSKYSVPNFPQPLIDSLFEEGVTAAPLAFPDIALPSKASTESNLRAINPKKCSNYSGQSFFVKHSSKSFSASRKKSPAASKGYHPDQYSMPWPAENIPKNQRKPKPQKQKPLSVIPDDLVSKDMKPEDDKSLVFMQQQATFEKDTHTLKGSKGIRWASLFLGTRHSSPVLVDSSSSDVDLPPALPLAVQTYSESEPKPSDVSETINKEEVSSEIQSRKLKVSKKLVQRCKSCCCPSSSLSPPSVSVKDTSSPPVVSLPSMDGNSEAADNLDIISAPEDPDITSAPSNQILTNPANQTISSLVDSGILVPANHKVSAKSRNKSAPAHQNVSTSANQNILAFPNGNVLAPVNQNISTLANPRVSTPANQSFSAPANPTVSTPANQSVSTPANQSVSTPANPTVSTPANPTLSAPANPKVFPPANPKVFPPANPRVSFPANQTTTAPANPYVLAPANKKLPAPVNQNVLVAADQNLSDPGNVHEVSSFSDRAHKFFMQLVKVATTNISSPLSDSSMSSSSTSTSQDHSSSDGCKVNKTAKTDKNTSASTSSVDHHLCPHWAHCGPNLALFDLLRVADVVRDMRMQKEFSGIIDSLPVYLPQLESWIAEIAHEMFEEAV